MLNYEIKGPQIICLNPPYTYTPNKTMMQILRLKYYWAKQIIFVFPDPLAIESISTSGNYLYKLISDLYKMQILWDMSFTVLSLE